MNYASTTDAYFLYLSHVQENARSNFGLYKIGRKTDYLFDCY